MIRFDAQVLAHHRRMTVVVVALAGAHAGLLGNSWGVDENKPSMKTQLI